VSERLLLLEKIEILVGGHGHGGTPSWLREVAITAT
jgi:hypothetical protein